MAYYIYLNHYRSHKGTQYLYVGSHVWKGPHGVIDPTYFGHSGVAAHYHWKPYKIDILEVVPEDRRLKSEAEWILRYCEQYGIADCARALSKYDKFINKFPRHGLMLNLHANTCEHLHSPEAEKKRVQSLLTNGKFPEVQRKATEAARAPEAVAKAYNSRVKSGAAGRWNKAGLAASRTPEAVAKRDATRRKRSQRVRFSDGFEGNAHELSVHTGMLVNSLQPYISKAHRDGLYTIKTGKYKGYTLIPIASLT